MHPLRRPSARAIAVARQRQDSWFGVAGSWAGLALMALTVIVVLDAGWQAGGAVLRLLGLGAWT